MKDGGSDIAPFHDFDATLPQEVKDAVAKAKQGIIDGTLKVTRNDTPVTSD
jgi:basic membrane protein A